LLSSSKDALMTTFSATRGPFLFLLTVSIRQNLLFLLTSSTRALRKTS
jgi:hypothetical protein